MIDKTIRTFLLVIKLFKTLFLINNQTFKFASLFKTIMNMKYIADINIMPMKALLDPQGKAVTGSMKNLGLSEIENIRIGKHITLEIEASNKEIASSKIDEACKKLLCNQIMEFYEFTINESK